MTNKHIGKMSEAIERSRALRAEAQRQRVESQKLMEEALELIENAPDRDDRTAAKGDSQKREKRQSDSSPLMNASES